MKNIGVGFMIGLCMFFCNATQAGAAEWEYYAENKEGDPLFFDTNIISISDNVVRVIQREVYDSDSLYWLKNRLGRRYEKLKETVNQIDINCKTAEYGIRTVTKIDSDGKVIDIFDYNQRFAWNSAIDSPDIYILYDLVCFQEWIYITSSDDSDCFLNRGSLRVNNSNANVTFWIKEIDKKTGKEIEKEKVTLVCEKDKYTLRHVIKYEKDGSVKEVIPDRYLRRWIRIKSKSIMEGFHDILCDDKYVRQNVKDYLKTVLK